MKERKLKDQYFWRLTVIGLVMLLLMACATPPAPTGGEEAAAEPETAAETVAEDAEGELPDVPRERTLVIMAGEQSQYTLFDNQNPYIPGSDAGFHSG